MSVVYLMVYVDDIVITDSDSTDIDNGITKEMLSLNLWILVLNYSLGIDVQVHDDSLLLSRSKYIKKLMQRIGPVDSTSLPTPIAGNFISKSDPISDDPPMVDTLLYRSTINALQHVYVIRSGINFVVNKLRQYM